ncbi:MAG: hypothetical protein Q9208_003252 [Pyrenodesmia sp. 3 TL-2023]
MGSSSSTSRRQQGWWPHDISRATGGAEPNHIGQVTYLPPGVNREEYMAKNLKYGDVRGPGGTVIKRVAPGGLSPWTPHNISRATGGAEPGHIGQVTYLPPGVNREEYMAEYAKQRQRTDVRGPKGAA